MVTTTGDMMAHKRKTPLGEAVDAYVAYGNHNGFFAAEMLLMKFLPDDKPDGKCSDVPASKLPEFTERLRSLELPEALLRLREGGTP